jgi:hypothetical protein
MIRNNDILNNLFGIGKFKSLEDFIHWASSDLNYRDKQEFLKLPLRARNSALIFGNIMGIFLALEGAEISATDMGIDLNMPSDLWAFNKFRAKCNAELFNKIGLRDEIPIQAAIMSEKMNWMAGATVDDLVQLREKGFMEEIRKIYRVNRLELQHASPENFNNATIAVVKRVTDALQEYNKEVESLKQSSSQNWFKKIGLFIISGSLGLTALRVPPLAAAIIAGIQIIAPGASVADLVSKSREDKKAQQELANRPIAHMLEIWNREADEDV